MSDSSPRHRVPNWLRWRGWLPAFVITAIGGFVLLALASWWDSFGFGLTLFVPFVLGWSLGFGTRVRKVFKIVLKGVLILSLAMGAATLHIGGVLCTLVLAAIMLMPVLVGMLVGHELQTKLKHSEFAQRGYTRLLVFLPPLGVLYGEAQLNLTHEIEVVQTSGVFDASASDVWQRLVFYEEIRLAPPTLARIGLPHPLYTSGTIRGVGDRKRCVYDSGYLVKEITDYEPSRLLGFDVIEQHGIEDRSIELIDGSFELTETSDGTVVTLTTRYRPLLSARVFWRPFEHALTHALHEHVLDGIEEQVSADKEKARS